MKNNILSFLLIVMVVLVASCKKEINVTEDKKQEGIDPTKVSKVPTTYEEKVLVENLGKVTEIFKELYKDKSNLKLVNAAIFAKTYTDETILLKDLIYPTESRLNSNDKFKKYAQTKNLSLNVFSSNFWNEVNKTNDAALKQFLNGLKTISVSNTSLNTDDGSGNNPQVSIYYPYSEVLPADFFGDGSITYDPITSVVTATADADEGWGNQPYYVNGTLQGYIQVLVNDDYAYNNPTQIIGVNGVQPYDSSFTPPTSAFPPGDPIDLPNLSREVRQVYIGDVRIRGRQYDKLISFTGNGGGSEIRFTRADGFLKVADGQVQTADVYFTDAKEIGRYEIRNHKWVNFGMEWDGDWEATNLQQNLGIYEEDNRNSTEFNGTISTTLKLSNVVTLTVGPIGFKITFKSDDDLIRQLNFNRDVFFTLNRTNLENELKESWPVRDKNGNVSYTLNDRTYF